jgi:exopolyphosphatase/guanosine-5'-triphosphate,3'-diphosphate pyrophosphatase
MAHPGVLDVRRGAVRRLAGAWAREPEHSERVRDAALALFDATADVHRLDAGDRELLEHGAVLHDIGASVATGGHHKHGAYLVEHAGLAGFDPEETAILASLVRFHKGSGPKPTFPLYAALRPAARHRTDVLVGLLRIADGLDVDRGARVGLVRVDAGDAGALALRVEAHGDIAGMGAGGTAKAQILAAALGRRVVLEVVEA